MKFLLFLSAYSLITSIAVSAVLKELPSNLTRQNGNSQSLEEVLNP